MGWSIGYDSNWSRDIGYGVPAFCDHPGCDAKIDRGLAYVCCGQQPYGGDDGCGLYFCGEHRDCSGRCERCATQAVKCTECGEEMEWDTSDTRLVCPAECTVGPIEGVAQVEWNPFVAKPDHPEWIRHKLTDASWGKWRSQNQKKVREMRAALAAVKS